MSSIEELAAQARDAAEGSYSPYSEFRVGAVIVAADGSRYTGANVENAAFGSSMCAEATAIGQAVASGVRKIDTVAVACIDAVGNPGFPCGNCRQLMVEFGVETVIVDGPDGPVVYPLTALLPHSFGPEDL
ncbi:cytidine deaminase [bacterium]|nr:cytidine deaminase [bacterium]